MKNKNKILSAVLIIALIVTSFCSSFSANAQAVNSFSVSTAEEYNLIEEDAAKVTVYVKFDVGSKYGFVGGEFSLDLPDEMNDIKSVKAQSATSLGGAVVTRNLIEIAINDNTVRFIVDNAKTSCKSISFEITLNVVTGLTAGAEYGISVSAGSGAFKDDHSQNSDIAFAPETKSVKVRTRMNFADVSTDGWYYEAVKFVTDRGYFSGYAGTDLFGTSDSIQRQDFLVMLARLDGADLTEYQGRASLSDVSADSYYAAAVAWGVEKGITTGYDDGRFGVGDKITREQLVTFLCRYACYKGVATDYSPSTEDTVSENYTDYINVSAFSKDSVLWAIEKRVISGKDPKTIAPQGDAQRCEVAQIIYNCFDKDILN